MRGGWAGCGGGGGGGEATDVSSSGDLSYTVEECR